MKKAIFSLALLLTCSLLGYAQKGISYQAVILDPKPIEIPGQDITGQPFVNGEVSLKFKLFSSTFVQEFEEVHAAKTDAYGLINVLIGSQNASAFSALVWDNNPRSMQVWVSFDQGGTYTKVSEQVLTYSPYSLYAETTGTAGKLSGTLTIGEGGTGAKTAANARTNLGLGNVDNTSDANKPVSIATQNALDAKANELTTYVNNQVAAIPDADAATKGKIQLAGDLGGTAASPIVPGLALKADALAVNAALNLKANAADVTNELALKADAATVNAALNLKANSADVTNELALKANAAETRTLLREKEIVDNKSINVLADAASDSKYPTVKSIKTYVDSQVAGATIADANASTKGKIQLAGDLAGTAAAPTVPGLALKANAADVTSALATKANSSDLTSGLALKANTADMTAVLAIKADAADVTTALNTKASSSDLTSGLALKANTADMTAALALKADAADVTTALNTKASTTDLTSGLALKANTTDMTAALASKANAADVTAALNTKASTTDLTSGLALKAPLASPTFTGTVTTAAINTGALSSTAVTAPTYASAPRTLTYTGSTINWNPALGLNAAITLTQNSTLSFTAAPPVGSYGTVVLTQDGTGGRTLTLPTLQGATNQVLGSTSTSTVALSTAASSKDILNFYYDGTVVYWNIGQGYGAASTTNSGPTNLASGVSGTLAVGNGGTGQTTLSGVKSILGLTDSKIAIGSDAGLTSQGNNAIALGYNAGLTNQGASSIAIGYLAGGTATQGNSSIAIGPISGGGGNESVAIGLAAWTGANNATAVGTLAAAGHVNSSAFGYQAVTTSPNTIQLGADGVTVSGSTAITNVRTSGSLTAGAVTYPNTNGTAGQVLTANNNGIASWATPASSGVPYTGATGAVNLGAYDLTVNGLTVGKGKKDAGTAYQYNTALGVSALNSFTGGTKNTALGYNALSAVTNSEQNIAIGVLAMGSTTADFQQSVAVGNQALQYNRGSFNTALGSNAISSQNLTSNATYLVGVGALALWNNTTGQNNTAVGSYALSTNTTGNNNTALGQGADVTSNNLSNATAIGYDAKVSASNTIQLGNTSVTNVKTSGALTAPIYASTPQGLTAGSTINWNPALGLNASVTLNQNSTINFSSTPTPGAYGTLVVTQDGTGGRTLALPTATNKVLGSSSTTSIALSTTANAIDIVNFYYDGNNYFWNVGQGYGAAATAATTNLASSVTGILPVANGGTGAATLTGYVKGTGTTAMTASATIPVADISGTLSVANGGTGATTLTANNVLLGNGTSALQAIAPGASGNVLTSNGTTWTSSAPSGNSGSGGHYVGEVYGGGIVFYVTAGGYHGLIASSTDIVANPMVIFDRATSPSYKSATNSEDLYTDWVTPSFSQLNILYNARATPGLNLGPYFYISTTFTDNDAFGFKGLNFSNAVAGYANGNWTAGSSGGEIRGRAIRTF